MVTNKDSPQETTVAQVSKVCLGCGYDYNKANALSCRICGKTLTDRNILYDLNKSASNGKKRSLIAIFVSDLKRGLRDLSKFVSQNIKPKTSRLLGVAIVGLGIALWGNYLLKIYTPSKTASQEASGLPSGFLATVAHHFMPH